MRFKGNRQLFVVSVYMPATQRKPEHKTDQAALLECIERIYADFRSRSTAHLILLGDWNSVKTRPRPASARDERHEHEVTFIRRGPSQHGAEEDGGDDGADDSDSEQDQQMDGPPSPKAPRSSRQDVSMRCCTLQVSRQRSWRCTRCRQRWRYRTL
eukprot:tig00000056_g24048.t1